MSKPSERQTDPAETVDLQRRLKAWAEQVGHGAPALVGDLAEIHAAARAIISSVEGLAAEPPPNAVDSRKALVHLDAWINDELVDHIGTLNTAMAGVINDLYR